MHKMLYLHITMCLLWCRSEHYTRPCCWTSTIDTFWAWCEELWGPQKAGRQRDQMAYQNTTAVWFISDNEDRLWREEVQQLEVWYKNNNLSLNVEKQQQISWLLTPSTQNWWRNGGESKELQIPWCSHYRRPLLDCQHSYRNEKAQ